MKKGSTTDKTLHDWFSLNEYHDVAILNCDNSGTELSRWVLTDCELANYSDDDYDAGSVKPYHVKGQVICTSDPDWFKV